MKKEYYKLSNFESLINKIIKNSEDWVCYDQIRDIEIHFPKITKITRDICFIIEAELKKKMNEMGFKQVIDDNKIVLSLNGCIHDAFWEILHEEVK